MECPSKNANPQKPLLHSPPTFSRLLSIRLLWFCKLCNAFSVWLSPGLYIGGGLTSVHHWLRHVHSPLSDQISVLSQMVKAKPQTKPKAILSILGTCKNSSKYFQSEIFWIFWWFCSTIVFSNRSRNHRPLSSYHCHNKSGQRSYFANSPDWYEVCVPTITLQLPDTWIDLR